MFKFYGIVQVRSVFDDFANLIASMDAAKIIAYKASPESQKKLDYLLLKSKTKKLSDDETIELQNYLLLDNIVSLAKAKAYKLSQNESKYS